MIGAGERAMAKATKKRGARKVKAGPKRKGTAKAGRKKVVRAWRTAGSNAASRLVAELEAEIRRLREEIATLREAPAARAEEADAERPPALEL